jgi:Serine carboxypeptidase
VYTEYFQAQLKLTRGRRDLVMHSIGITNGCIDVLQQAPFFPQFAINNTYDLQAIPTSVAEEAAANFTKPAGCRDLLIRCRTLADQGDSGFRGDNLTINQACVEATSFCLPYVLRAYDDFSNVLYSILAPPPPPRDRRLTYIPHQRSAFDIAVPLPDPCASNQLQIQTFFNQPWVRSSLNVPLNFTSSSLIVRANFLYRSGDLFRLDTRHLQAVLASGVKVAMVYGDRDYQCNCKSLPLLLAHTNTCRPHSPPQIRERKHKKSTPKGQQVPKGTDSADSFDPRTAPTQGSAPSKSASP